MFDFYDGYTQILS